jgi:hypothetical protein
MFSVLDAIAAVIRRAGDSWLGMLALSSPLWVLAAVRARGALRRRRACQAFAAAHAFRFAGTIPSDARAPYTRIDRVSRAVLLSNVLEGEWEGLAVRVCDMAPGRRRARWTTILVTVEDTLQLGPGAQRVIDTAPVAPLIETNLDVLSVSPRRRLDASELPVWLSFATTLAKAMERDFTDARRRTDVAFTEMPGTIQ